MKLINILSILTIVAFNFMVILIVYWLVRPYNPIDVKEPIKIENKFVKGGDYLIYSVDYCKNTTIVPTVTRYFVDGISYLISENQTAKPKGKGCGTNSMQLYVPKALAKGEYKLQIIYRYQMNPLRQIDVTIFSEPFMVQ